MAKDRAVKGREKTDLAASYNALKDFHGRRYTGMKIGRSHTWNYDAGEWKETKITPDQWEFNFTVTKRRKGKAPEGSGVPVGTEYHWYILAHQVVKKLNANEYSTVLKGLKYKLAHRRAGHAEWSISDKTQRQHLIGLLRGLIADLSENSKGEAARPEKGSVVRLKPRRMGRMKSSYGSRAKRLQRAVSR